MIRRSSALVALAAAALAALSASPAAAAPPTEPLAPVPPTTIVAEATTPPEPITTPSPTTASPPTSVPDGTAAPDELLAPTVPLPPLPPIEDPDAVSARLIPIPPGCPAPRTEQAVFVGTLVAKDEFTGRFLVHGVRSGSVDGFTAAGMIDVRYGDEARFLAAGDRYLVGAAIDEETGILSSAVRAPAPGFGGSEVAAVSASDLVCPEVGDPVRTLRLDGTSVESGVLTPLGDAKWRVLRAVLQPIGVALLVLIGLSSLKLLVFTTARSMREIGDRPPKDALDPRSIRADPR